MKRLLILFLLVSALGVPLFSKLSGKHSGASIERDLSKNTLVMSLHDISKFEYDPAGGKQIPVDVLKLNGLHVRLRGYIVPSATSGELDHFMLSASVVGCIFCQPPAVQEMVAVEMSSGKKCLFTMDEVVVEGDFHVSEKQEDGYITSIFQMTDAVVFPGK